MMRILAQLLLKKGRRKLKGVRYYHHFILKTKHKLIRARKKAKKH